ncbi:DNA internalization-related competence protein ComEC/Rec2 [Lentilactobacillus otakiensis]|uniref:DNA internalization-related competence protein ComEC/Rec2 n=1 Tax=Lentilactobacillus otakiensis TaxID=481720 RepID=UPI003D16F6AD
MSMIIYGNAWIGVCLMGLLVLRIFFLRDSQVLIGSIMAVLMFACGCWLTHQYMRPLTGQKTYEVKIYPDVVKVNGASLSFIAHPEGLKQKMVFYARLRDKGQQRQVVDGDQPIRVKVTGKFSDFLPATNINQFDMEKYYHHQKIQNCFVAESLSFIGVQNKFSMIDRIHMLRSKFNQYCGHLPKTLSLYATGLISGYRPNNFFDEMTGVKKLGLLHIFSISGMHVAYFLSIVDQLMVWMGLSKFKKAVISIVFLGGYFIFSGGSPGLLRAVIMAIIGIINRLFKLGFSQLDVWSGSLIINLLILPEAIFLMGVQLSYGLSLGLIASEKLSYFKQTILLNLLTVPILLFHIYEWHFLSVAVNLIVLPFFGKVIFPVVILGVICGLLAMGLTIPIDGFLQVFNDGLNAVSELPGMIVFGKPTLLVVLIMLMLTILLTMVDKRSVKGIVVLLSTVYLATFAWIHFPLYGEVTMFDIGQGDSFLIREPFNRTVTMIDTGGKVQFNSEPWQKGTQDYQAKRLSINYLKSIGISKIDNMCVSHQDADHCGDLPAFIEEMKIDRIIIPLGMDKNPGFMERISGRSHDTKLLCVNDEMRVANLPAQIYHPYLAGKGENHDSMVLGANKGGLSWLFTGDLDRPGELDTIARHPGLSADVLKVGHHGSKTSSDPQFVSAVKPKIALISAGRNNRYGHPNDETLVTLKQHNVKIFNTQKHGMVGYIYRNNTGHFETALDGHEGNV